MRAMIPRTAHRGVALAAVVALFATGGAGLAYADEDRLREMEQRAMESYQLLEYEEAQDILSDAIVYAKRNRLGDSDAAARIHLKLGVVFFAGFEDENAAAIEFVNAVEIDPDIQIPAAYRTSAMEELLGEIREDLVGDGASASCPGVSGVQHELVEVATAGRDRDIDVQVGDEVDVGSVVLYYRGQGTSDYDEIEMRQAGGCSYSGHIPGGDIAGDYLYYYIEAARGGERVGGSGSAGTPNIIEVSGDAALDAENPLDGVGDDPGARSRAAEIFDHNVFVMLLAGTGGGYVSGSTEVEQERVGCCFAPSIMHAVPEIGIFVNPQVTVSVGSRVGFPLLANAGEGPATAAPAGTARLRYVLNDTGVGTTLNFLLGGGVMRNTVPLAEPSDDGDTDTAASGPVIVGAGVGYSFALGDRLQLVTELNALAGVPVVQCIGDCGPTGRGVEPGFALQFDGNVGLLLGF